MLESCWVSTCTQRLAWWAENPSLISFTDCLFTSFEAAQSSRTVRELVPLKVQTYHFQSKCNPVLLADDCRSLSAKWSRGFKWMLGRWVQHNQTCHRRGRSSSLQTADVFPVIPPQNNVIFWRNDRKYLCCSQATSVLVHKELHHPPVSRFYNESIEQNIAEVHAWTKHIFWL